MAIGDNLTKRDQILIFASVLFIGLGAAYGHFLYLPKGEALKKLERRVASLERKNESARREAAAGNIGKINQQAAEYGASLAVLKELVPTTNEVPALLEGVSTAARRVGLDLASVEPMPVIRGETFDTYRYKLSVKGGYHSVAAFLANVGSLNRIIAPVSVDVKPVSGQGSRLRLKEGEAGIETDFQIQTYIARIPGYTEGEEQAEGGA